MRRTTYIAQAGIIAAVYAAATVGTLMLPAGLGWGLVQFRLSEALTVLAVLTPAAVPGLTLGCAVANAFMITQFGPVALLDVTFGSVATLLGAFWAWRMRDRTGLALAGPVVVNALIVPAYLPIILAGMGLYRVPFLGMNVEGSWIGMYLLGVLGVGFGQAVVVYGLGWPLLATMRARGFGVSGGD